MNDFRHFIPIVIGTVVSTSMMGAEPDLATTNATFGQTVTFGSLPTGIWQGEVGEGFRSSAQTLSIEAGDAAGFQAFGGRRITIWLWPASHTATLWVRWGGGDYWYRGNWELRGELFSDAQFSPSTDCEQDNHEG